MKHIRTLGLSTTAVLALSLALAGTASAKLPEWGGCEATQGGKYVNETCTEKAASRRADGRYEWYTGDEFGIVHNQEKGRDNGYGIENYEFKASISATTFETTAGKQIGCTGGYGEIELGPRANEIKDTLLTFKGCHEVGGDEEACSSAFYPAGIGAITNEEEWASEQGLRGTLGFLEGAGTGSPVVGISLTSFNKVKPETKERERLFEVICEGSLSTVSIGGFKKGGNAVISLIAPVDTMTTDYTQTFAGKEDVPGVQAWTAFEGGKHGSVLDEFLNFGWEQSAWITSLTDTSEEGAPPIEIKALS